MPSEVSKFVDRVDWSSLLWSFCGLFAVFLRSFYKKNMAMSIVKDASADEAAKAMQCLP